MSAGTLCTTGTLSVRATAVGASTELARIIECVREAQGSKAPVQRLVDRISRVFVPAVMAISAITFLCGGLLARLTPSRRAGGGIGACDCLPLCIVTATPTAVMVGIGRGARNGILVKEASALEQLAKVNLLAIDKTGTLTEGKPKVTEISRSQQLPESFIKP